MSKLKRVKVLLVLCFLSILIISTTVEAKSPKTKAKMCWVCNGSSAYAYHRNANCRGLKRCTGSIERITQAQAKKESRKPCKLCYGKTKHK